ncbi:hypothetical protein PG911_03560 [Tenacibaculum ovolyticum]|uniref:hypothetical protein n=1 Tax=Tenacibaculum ovolyticum TaxID=104270 RepID=UPI0022F3A98B|nr:hypothetical protein [Tenacibaculum ovolyticum]WBX77350.1 hypothetical protein PG911_03560 [Tenacibaculum ovolyticum]
MLDRHLIRNSGLGMILLISIISFSISIIEKINLSEISDKTLPKTLIILIIGFISSPAIGRLISTFTIVVLSKFGNYYTDDARKQLTKEIFKDATYEKYDQNYIENNKKFDSVFVTEYYDENSKIYSEKFIEWCRRQRDGQFFSANVITSLILGFLISVFSEISINDNLCKLNLGILLPIIILIFVQYLSYIFHKTNVDTAEYLWVKRKWNENKEE